MGCTVGNTVALTFVKNQAGGLKTKLNLRMIANCLFTARIVVKDKKSSHKLIKKNCDCHHNVIMSLFNWT